MASDPGKEPTICVRNAYKKYSSTVVLRGLNMTVPQGCIYGLLGPSGCGKTTLFKCIVGRQKLESGEIRIKAKIRQHIGYMPQDVALYKEFTIQETLVYYGMLCGKSRGEIATRTEELIKLLDLPPAHSVVDTLSGGQRRRVSFCVALLHNPQILILDEPTVGLDPLLSQSIWGHLINLATKEHKTVVITTHYIEEARQAHVIGMMREGVLLAEDSPQHLMESLDCTSLEQAFLRLSQTQTDSVTVGEILSSDEYLYSNGKSKTPFEDDTAIRLHRIKAQTLKSIYWMRRNVEIMLFIIFLPVMSSLLSNVCVGHDPQGLRMGYLNEEVTPGRGECVFAPVTGCHIDSLLSCRFLDTLRDKLEVVEYETFEDGIEAVQSNTIWGLMHFNSNYTLSYVSRLNDSNIISDETIDLSEVTVWMDMSDQYIGNMIKRDLYYGFISFQRKLFEDCHWPAKMAEVPVAFQEAIYGSNNPSFVHFTVPAIVTVSQFYTPMLFTCAAILMEKKNGLLDRNLVAGLNVPELLISHLAVQLVVLGIHTPLTIGVCTAIFDNPLLGSLPLFVSLLMMVGLSGMCYGFLVSIYSESDTEATILGLGSFCPLTFLSGIVWPLEGMHYILRAFSWALPLTLATEAYRAIAMRAWDLTHPTVFKGFLSCLAWMLVFTLVSTLIVRHRKGIGSKKF